MSRNKYIIYSAIVLLLLLAVVFLAQIRKLQKQLPASVRIIPSESKSRNDVAQDGPEQIPVGTRPEVLVKFRPGISEEQINQIAARFNDELQDHIEAVPGLTAIDDRDNGDAAKIAGQYRGLPEVEYAEANYELDINPKGSEKKESNSPRGMQQWALERIEVQQAWDGNNKGRGFVIGLLDTGVEYTHPGLVNNIWTRPPHLSPYHDSDLGTIDDVHGYNAAGNDGDPADENGHGTAAAGIIVGRCENGSEDCSVSPQVEILPLKFINAGGFGYMSDAVKAINYAIERKRAGVNLRVINVGWDLAEPSRALEDVIRAAYAVGILFVVSSGSDGTNNDARPRYPASFRLGNILSVAASNRNDTLAYFSNYGANSVQIAAPGEDILTTALGNEYQLRSDTTMATAVVTGVAALVLSSQSGLSVDQLRSLLIKSADNIAELRAKVSTSGRINARKAAAP